MTAATERTLRRSSGSRPIRFSTACWIVAGRASDEISMPPAPAQAPVAFCTMLPASSSDRTSLASAPPTRVARNWR